MRTTRRAFLGAAAALLSRTAHVGFVGGMEMPLLHKFAAGYEAGVHAVCPGCTVHVAYAGTSPDGFKDPARCAELAPAGWAEPFLGSVQVVHAREANGFWVHGCKFPARLNRAQLRDWLRHHASLCYGGHMEADRDRCPHRPAQADPGR